jgi:hypothetical protein
MTKKPTGLAAFTGGRGPAQLEESGPPSQSKPATETGTARKRAQGETVALTVRVTRADWARLHQLAVAEGVSLQTLALQGLSKVFAEHGLPPITP